MISMNLSTPLFKLESGLPDMLPERSSISTMSVGFVMISGSPVSDSFILKIPPQSILEALISLLELVIPILLVPF